MAPNESECRFLILHTNLFCAWMFNMAYSCALVLLSTWCVVTKAPQAGGAGVAEVMAYLNGCQIPKVLCPVTPHPALSHHPSNESRWGSFALSPLIYLSRQAKRQKHII